MIVRPFTRTFCGRVVSFPASLLDRLEDVTGTLNAANLGRL